MTQQSWSRLTRFLSSDDEPLTILSFQQIERILEHPLPASARNHSAFWSNTSSYSRAWRDAGREVSRRGLLPEQVKFTQTASPSDAAPQSSEPAALHLVPEIAGSRPALAMGTSAVGTSAVGTSAGGTSAGGTNAVGTNAVGPEQGADVLLLGCVKGKSSSPQKAKDLYVPDLFDKRRGYADQRELPWFVLSAEHGLLRQDDWVAPMTCR